MKRQIKLRSFWLLSMSLTVAFSSSFAHTAQLPDNLDWQTNNNNPYFCLTRS